MGFVDDIVDSIPSSLPDLGFKIDNIELFPVFLIVHYYLVALSLRHQAGSVDHARHHPFASLFVCVTSSFGGLLLQNLLLGRPIVDIYLNTTNVAMASLVWYLVFFAPKDLVIEVCEVKLIKALILVLKEVHRFRGIRTGVALAHKMYYGNWLIAILLGSVRGSGAKFVGRPLYHFIQGNLRAENEFLRPTFSTKHSVVSSALLLCQMTGVIDIKINVLIALLVSFAAIVQVLLLLTDMRDPYTNLEEMFCKIFLDLPHELSKKDSKKKVE